MALPLTGPLGINQIRTELGIPSKAPFQLDLAENGDNGNGYPTINQASLYKPSASNPAAISEWYGYDHTATKRMYFYLSVMPRPDTTKTSYACDPDWGENFYTGSIKTFVRHDRAIGGIYYVHAYYENFYPSSTILTGITTHPCRPYFVGVSQPMFQPVGYPDRFYISVYGYRYDLSEYRRVKFGFHTTITRPQDGTGFTVPYTIYEGSPGVPCPVNPPPHNEYSGTTTLPDNPSFPQYASQPNTDNSLAVHVNIRRRAVGGQDYESLVWTDL